MILTSDMYVPSLRWRQGEYQGLFRLADAAKGRIIPLITIPEIEFDFEAWCAKKTVHEHVHPFAARYKAKWGGRPAWIAVTETIIGESMDDGRDIFSYVFDALRAYESAAIPAISLQVSPNTIAAVKRIAELDGRGAAIMLRLEDLMKLNVRTLVLAVAAKLKVGVSEIDLLLDIGAPKFEPYAGFAIALIAALTKLGNLHDFRNLVLIATAIPESFSSLAKGGDEVTRHEWLFYKDLKTRMPKNMRLPNFGDHTIVHPKFAAIDMRKVKPSGKVIYTTPDSWLVHKGGAFRDNREQMHDHCAAIVASGYFRGEPFSDGDSYIARCAAKLESPSNQSRWKDIAVNHHVTHVLDDIAKLYGAT